MMKRAKWTGWLALAALAATLAGCDGAPQGGAKPGQSAGAGSDLPEFVIVGGSENESLEPLIESFLAKQGYKAKFVHKGSVDIMSELRSCPKGKYDAVWPAASIWLTLGDTGRCVKNAESVMTTPVTFNVAKSKAEAFGWIGRPVTVAEIAEKIRSGELSFMMTSATQSNSGAMGYMGFLYALAGSPDVLEAKHLDSPKAQNGVREILGGVDRAAGSSGWLKDAFVKGSYKAMVNYESMAIEANRELVKQGREPLVAIYPADGTMVADSPLGLLDNGDAKKAQAFAALQKYLASDEVAREAGRLGRRAGFGAMDAPAEHPEVFRAEWGMQAKAAFRTLAIPAPEVVEQALMLYQQKLRKPSYTIFVLDYSGSMRGNGGEGQLKNAMGMLLDDQEAKRFWLQSTDKDVFEAMAFSDEVIGRVAARSPKDRERMLAALRSIDADGGTAAYSSAMQALRSLQNRSDLESYSVAVVLMTDGDSNSGIDLEGFRREYAGLKAKYPVFAIGFGSAPSEDLERVAELTGGAYFQAKSDDLAGAFRKARGFN